MIRSLLMATALLLTSSPALAWGDLGHRLIAGLASDDLTPQARAEVARLLAGEPEPTLAGIANWADDLRDHEPDLGRKTAPWHYVNLGEDGCRYDAARDCRNGDCVVEAIRRQSAILADRRRSRGERLQALKFVVHFVGDAHQPLHAGYARDKGANTVQVNLDERGTNLHALWDSGLFKTANLDEQAYLAKLRGMPMPADTATSRRTSILADASAWAEASCATALTQGLYPPKASIDEEYVLRWRPMAEAQLRLGGMHLAEVLNATLYSSPQK